VSSRNPGRFFEKTSYLENAGSSGSFSKQRLDVFLAKQFSEARNNQKRWWKSFRGKIETPERGIITRGTAISTATRGINFALRQSAFSGFPQRQQ